MERFRNAIDAQTNYTKMVRIWYWWHICQIFFFVYLKFSKKISELVWLLIQEPVRNIDWISPESQGPEIKRIGDLRRLEVRTRSLYQMAVWYWYNHLIMIIMDDRYLLIPLRLFLGWELTITYSDFEKLPRNWRWKNQIYLKMRCITSATSSSSPLARYLGYILLQWTIVLTRMYSPSPNFFFLIQCI